MGNPNPLPPLLGKTARRRAVAERPHVSDLFPGEMQAAPAGTALAIPLPNGKRLHFRRSGKPDPADAQAWAVMPGQSFSTDVLLALSALLDP